MLLLLQINAKGNLVKILKTTWLVSFSLLMFTVQTISAETFVRKNASTQAAAADLAALAKALKLMREMGCENPFSWYSQGATHSIPEKVSNNKLCPMYSDRSDLLWSWNTCTHVDGSEIHFLVWHRMFILHFEEIVRELSGKQDFALPYWDYTDTKYRVMPKPLSDQNNSLYAKARLPLLNNEGKIEAFMDPKLDITNLFENKVFRVFNSNIDAAPHGAMHVYIGGGYAGQHMYNPIFQNSQRYGLMQAVESAGFDPVFWLHHSNIDYLWQKWEMSPKGIRPSLQELEAVPWPYQFYTADGSKKEYTIAEAYKAAFDVDYVYDVLNQPIIQIDTRFHEELVDKNEQQKQQLLWTMKPKLESIDRSISITPAQLKNNQRESLLESMRQQPLVIEMHVSFAAEPRDSYQVFIVDENQQKSLAGVMTFFGAAHHMGLHEGHDMRVKKKFLFDVSNELPANDNYTLVIESSLSNEEPIRIDQVTLYRY